MSGLQTRSLPAVLAALALLAAPTGAAAGPMTPTPAFACPAASVGPLAVAPGTVRSVRQVDRGSGLLGPTGDGGWYGLRLLKAGGWPAPGELYTAGLHAGAPVKNLAHVSVSVWGVAVADGFVVNEAGGTLTAYTTSGSVAWRTPIGDGAALGSDGTSIDAVGTDVIAIVSPGTAPAVGHVVGVDAATGQVNMRSAAIPDLDMVASVACADGALYVVNDQMPAPGPIRPGYNPSSLNVVRALSTATGRLLWQRRFIIRSPVACNDQVDYPPVATNAGLLWFRAPILCPPGKGASDVRGQLFAHATGRVVWQAAYPASLGPPASNGTLVAVPKGGGRVAVRVVASGRLVRTIALPRPQALQFATGGSIVADTFACGHGPSPACRGTTAVYTWSGGRVGTFPVGGQSVPTVATGGRVYVQSQEGWLVYRVR